MKVLYFIEGNGGGAVTHVLNLAKKLPRKIIHPLIVFFLNGPSVQVAKEMGIDTRVLPWRFPLDVTLMWRLRTLIQQERMDIVHTHTITGNFYARVAVSLSRRPASLITTIHSCIQDELSGSIGNQLKDYLRFKREILMSGRVDQFIAVSEKLKQRMIEFRIPKEKIEVVENGIEPPDLSEATAHHSSIREEFKIKREETIIATVGRMVPVKNQHLLLQAAQHVLKKSSQVKFLFVGDGKLMSSLQRHAQDLHIDEHVIFPGWRSDINRFLCAMDVFVLCSKVEGFNMSVLEAMAHMKPVIATRVRGIADIIQDGETGVLIPPNNADSLAQAILGLIEDRDRATQLGRKGRQLVEDQYTLERMVERTLGMYEKVHQGKAY